MAAHGLRQAAALCIAHRSRDHRRKQCAIRQLQYAVALPQRECDDNGAADQCGNPEADRRPFAKPQCAKQSGRQRQNADHDRTVRRRYVMHCDRTEHRKSDHAAERGNRQCLPLRASRSRRAQPPQQQTGTDRRDHSPAQCDEYRIQFGHRHSRKRQGQTEHRDADRAKPHAFGFLRHGCAHISSSSIAKSPLRNTPLTRPSPRKTRAAISAAPDSAAALRRSLSTHRCKAN